MSILEMGKLKAIYRVTGKRKTAAPESTPR